MFFSKKKLYIGLIALFAIIFAAPIYWLFSNLLTQNYHAVIPGKVYRSAELDASELRYHVQKDHIKSIINLRNAKPKKRWYQDEIIISKHFNIKHYNLGVPAHMLPTATQVRTLVSVLQVAPQPILIHCLQGADRSGLASAIALILAGNSSPNALKKQISYRYSVSSPSSVGYMVLRNYFDWLKQHHLKHSKQHFLKWVAAKQKYKIHHGWFIG